MGQFGKIFISYRRSDSRSEAGRIYDKLAGEFGADCIFKDVDNIPYGADFVEYLSQAVAQCDVLLVLIGQEWLRATNAEGTRRLDDIQDFVRIEIASALKRDILVVPVLLNETMMPVSEELPPNLQSLARRNAVQVRQDPDFHRDMERFISNLKDYLANRQNLQANAPPVGSALTQRSHQNPNAAALVNSDNGSNSDRDNSSNSDLEKDSHSNSTRSIQPLVIGIGLLLLIGLGIGVSRLLLQASLSPSQPAEEEQAPSQSPDPNSSPPNGEEQPRQPSDSNPPPSPDGESHDSHSQPKPPARE